MMFGFLNPMESTMIGLFENMATVKAEISSSFNFASNSLMVLTKHS